MSGTPRARAGGGTGAPEGRVPFTSPPRPGRVAAHVGLLVLGGVVGIAGSLIQGAWSPGGLVLALLATAAVFVGGREATGSLSGLGVAAAGWLVSVILLSMGRPEGDGAFAAGVGPFIYLLGGMVVAVICATVSRSTGRSLWSGQQRRQG